MTDLSDTNSGLTTVYLARHGRTALNAEDRLRGLSDPPLDEVGLAEVARLAKVLATQHPVAILSSPLQRAVSTAEAIASASGITVSVDKRLNDRDYGQWTGQLRAEVVERFGSVEAAPGVESAQALADRARAAFFAIVAEYTAGPLVLVSHDAFNKALLRQLDPTLTDLVQPTACWNRISLDGVWHVDAFDRKP